MSELEKALSDIEATNCRVCMFRNFWMDDGTPSGWTIIIRAGKDVEIREGGATAAEAIRRAALAAVWAAERSEP